MRRALESPRSLAFRIGPEGLGEQQEEASAEARGTVNRQHYSTILGPACTVDAVEQVPYMVARSEVRTIKIYYLR